jgi:hypothetical protein
MSDSPPPDASLPPSPATRTVRTFKNRATAEAAVEKLKGHGIEGSILELAPPPGRPALISEAVRLVVDSEHAAQAMRLLANFTIDNGGAAGLGQGVNRGGRRKPRPTPRVNAGPPWLFIIIALMGAGGAIFYGAWSYFGPEAKPVTVLRPRERYVNEDTNHDGKIDQRRYLAASGEILRDEFDVDFDGKWDVRTSYDRGRLKRRSTDLDRNGIMDEDVFYDRMGRPFYSQLIMNGKGPATKRSFYQEAMEFPDWEPTAEDPGPSADPTQPGGGDSWPFRVLLDTDADGHFDLDQKLNLKGEVIDERKLEKGALENSPPTFP